MTCNCSISEGDNPPTRYEEEHKSSEDACRETEEADKTTNKCKMKCCYILKSTKHSPECGRIFENTTPLLITATPRSGTVGTTKFLRELGLPLSNDAHAPTKFGMVSWIHCVYSQNDEYYGRIKLHGSGFNAVLHQRRHVRKSITSLVFTTPFGTTPKRGKWSHHLYKNFVKTHVALDTTRSIQYMGLQMWVEWQLLIRSIADWHYRVEDLMSAETAISQPIVERIFASAKLPAPSTQAIENALGKVDLRANTRKHRSTLSWEEIFEIDERYASIAYTLSKEYGYD